MRAFITIDVHLDDIDKVEEVMEAIAEGFRRNTFDLAGKYRILLTGNNATTGAKISHLEVDR